MTKQEKITHFNPSGVGIKNGRFIGLPFDEEDAQIVLLPVPWDVTVSFGEGTSTGAQNILECSPQLDLYDPDLEDAWKTGIYMRHLDLFWLNRNEELRPLADAYIDFIENGGHVAHDIPMTAALEEINNSCKLLNAWVDNETTTIMQSGKKVGIVGGEHSVPLGFMTALARRYGVYGILQIDAHQDLRKAYEGFNYSHASIFFNALKIKEVSRLVQVGIRDFCQEEVELGEKEGDRVKVWTDQYMKEEVLKGAAFQTLCKRIIEDLPEKVYVSFDIDGMMPNLCPNTGTPVPGGLQYNEALFLIKSVVESGREIIGFDLCEVAGVGNDWDGNVGARLLYKLCNLMTKSLKPSSK